MPRAPSDQLIDLIYDAAVNPRLWDRVMIEIACMLSSAYRIRKRSVRKGSYTKEKAKVIESLVPHLRRARGIVARLHTYHALARDQQQLLDLLNFGIIVIDQFGAARCVNRAAHEMVAKNKGLALRNAPVSASDHCVDTELARLIRRTVSSGIRGTLALRRQGSEVPLVVLACPLRGPIRYQIGRRGEPRPAVALFIKDPALAGAPLNDVLMQSYHLTPAETRVAALLGAGFGTVGASRHLAVSKNTVKTHAKHIYEKMGLRSQRELVQLFGRLAVSARALLVCALYQDRVQSLHDVFPILDCAT